MSCIDETYTPERVLSLAKKNKLYGVPSKYITKEAYQLRLECHPYMFDETPKEHITLDLYQKCAKKIGCIIYYVSPELLTKEMCLDAVKAEWQCYSNIHCALEYIPKKFITKELCLIAVKHYPKSIHYVPKEYITSELWLLAVRHEGILKCVPHEYITHEVILEALCCDHTAINHVPKEYLTRNTYVYAVLKHGKAIQYIPKEYINYDLCVAAVSNDSNAIEHVPPEYITKELCNIAVYQCGDAIIHIPDEYITDDLCDRAITNGCYDSKYIRSKEMCIRYCYMNRKSFLHLQLPHATYIAYLTGVMYGLCLQCIPKWYLTKELCMIAMGNWIPDIDSVPQGVIDNDICEAYACNKNADLKDIPVAYRTKKVCMLYLKTHCKFFDCIPESILSEEFILSALKANHEVIRYVPFALRTTAIREYILEFSDIRQSIQDKLPPLYYQWKHEKTTQSLQYYCKNIKTAKKYSDVIIRMH
jgi:hypothetical protein